MRKKWNRLTSAVTAVVIGLAAVVGAALTTATPEPTLHLEGVELRNVLNGDGTTSIQALVNVYASDMPTLNAASMILEYNKDYWEPSRISDNSRYGATTSMTTSDFFMTNPDLYGGTGEPFMFADPLDEDHVTTIDMPSGKLMLALNLKKSGDLPDVAGDKVEILEADPSGSGTGKLKLTYINAQEKTFLGTMSFWVNPDHLADMTADAVPPANENSSTHGTLALALNHFMYPTDQIQGTNIPGSGAPEPPPPWTGNYWDPEDLADPETPKRYDDGSANSITSHFHTKYEIPDVIINAEAAAKDVVINAYQAYTDATPADLAAALTRYSSAVRLTYPDGDQRDEAMFWGKDEDNAMTIVDNTSGSSTNGNIYRFWYDSSAPNGYVFQQVDSSGNVLVADATGDYDPTHGTYTITQPYHYVENETEKTYPAPIKVELEVTPVKVIDFTADGLKKSYKINDPNLPGDCDALELPEEGKLVFDTVLSGTIPAMPLTTWTNGSVTLPVTNMHDLTGVDGGATVNWPTSATEIAGNVGVGDYDFTCADPTQAAIRQAHPWATVDSGYTVTAKRTILPDTADEPPEYIVKAYIADPSGIQTIQVSRQDGQPMNASTFEVYRPDGVYVDPSWFASNTAMTNPGGAHTALANGIFEYLIYTDPGVNPSNSYPNHPAERETTRRHINLGGYFTVVVHETGCRESDPIRVYQRRRQNVYLYHYNIPENGTITANNRFEFDFTGHKAGLYPFHTYSTLPNTVVLPLDCGYIVHTRYDGVTGGEPGEVRTFTVGSWAPISANPSGATPPNWTAGDVVTHGASQFSNRSYASGFGMVENALTPPREVKMLVEADDETLPPTEGLTLTYEGPSAPSNILENGSGEVGTVVFDTVQEGYGYKQEFELTLTNTGTTDIHGIYIDTLFGPQNDSGKQHFEIIKPPATDLAPGASTTFIITYVLGLEKSTGLPEKTYVDNIHVGTAEGTTKDFIARFKVVDGALYKLTVQPRPEDKSMGDGGAVTGVVSGTYDPTPVGSKLMETDPVWISVKPLDEYAIKEITPGVPEVYYYDTGSLKIYLTPYVPAGTADKPANGEFLFQLPGGMPPHNTTVYVDFEEPIPSKLRLSDLKAYADDEEPSCITSPNQQIMYDMTDPTYGTTGFDPDHTDYLVVIPADADFSGLELTLYNIIATHEVIGAPYSSDTPVLNAVIQPDVQIQLDDIGNTVVLDEKGWVGNVADGAHPTPTVHQVTFQSPDPGKAKTATITISYFDGTTLHKRTDQYKVKFVRRTEVPVHTFAYGNTPFGMIMNAQNIAAGNKEAAKESYLEKDRFIDPQYTPTKAAVTGKELTDYVYWPEAWEGEYPDWPEDWGERNLDRNDYALVAYVGEKFADPGIRELLDSTGKKVVNQSLTRWVEVALLDDEGTSVTGVSDPADNANADRFNGTDTAVITLPALPVNGGGIGAIMELEELTNWETVNDRTIRPGIYALTYEFVDFDGATRSFTRPLVLLRHLGDIDAYDGPKANDDDAEYIRQRVILDGMLADTSDVVNYPDWDKTLYRYRICDVNNDRNINNIDANRIQNETTLTDFYRPVDYAG